MKNYFLSTVLLALALTSMIPQSHAQSGPLLGEIKLFAGNFAPRGWSLCDGALIPISSNSALFSILGTMYGGDGRTTFALPDLRGRTPVGIGKGQGVPAIDQGQKIQVIIGPPPENPTKENSSLVSGLGLHYIICISGTFPSRN